jgi:polyribonucleotide nucleotidyltransferase
MSESCTISNPVQTIQFTIGDKVVSLETGRLAKSAGGAVLVTCDDTVILVTATGSASPRPGIDFFPLLVDYEEKMAAVGRFPGGYLKKEGRASERATLTSRLIDRPIRPLFPDGYRNDVQIVATTLSLDSVNPPDVLSILGASVALELSGLPFDGPIGAVRVGRIDGQWIANPTYVQLDLSDLDLVVAGTHDSIMMVEAGATFVSEADLLSALDFAHNVIKEQVRIQQTFKAQCGVTTQAFVPKYDLAPLYNFVNDSVLDDVKRAYHNADRTERRNTLNEAKTRVIGLLAELADDHEIKVLSRQDGLDHVGEAFKKAEKKVMRAMVIEEGVRADGRNVTEIRPISCETKVLPRAHGTGLFTRGSTQVLSIATLGSPGDAQKLDGVDPQTEKRWIHHYNFPGFSVGEVKPMRGAGRREIGHGALAERAIAPSLPSKDRFPYTLRVNSEVLESNGSTSMASTCGATLALMDAGVPIDHPVGGIAMGLIKEGDRYEVLSDIQGIEDFLGDMDFKVTGSRDGVTALQMDIKIRGISLDIMRQALEQARLGRLHILDKMATVLPEANDKLSKWAPRIISMRIGPDQIGSVIGPGGKMIRSIIEETGAQIDIEDDGLVMISSVGEGGELAKAKIEKLTLRIERGLLMLGKVVRIIPAGAFVELVPGKDGMVHISQIVPRRLEKVEDALSVGQLVPIKVVDIDDRGRVNLTIKGLTEEEHATLGTQPFV